MVSSCLRLRTSRFGIKREGMESLYERGYRCLCILEPATFNTLKPSREDYVIEKYDFGIA